MSLFRFHMDRRLIAKAIVTTMIVMGWLAIEGYNMGTTWSAINQIFGEKVLVLNILLVLGIVAIDFGGLTRIAMPRTHQDDKYWTIVMATIWFVIAVINAAFTWWNVGIDLANQTIATPHGVTSVEVVFFVPVFIAGIIFLVRVGMMMAFGQMLDSWLGGPVAKRPLTMAHPQVTPDRGTYQPRKGSTQQAAYQTIAEKHSMRRANGNGD